MLIFKHKKKKKQVFEFAVVNIKTTFNNTIVTVTDLVGNSICWSSSGSSGFKGARKNSPYAAQCATKNAITKAIEFGIKKVAIILKGRGSGREACIRFIVATNLTILSIEDCTPIAHNGCRPPKKRRL